MMNTCEMLKIALRDEKDAPNMYEKIKGVLNKGDSANIQKIINDEKRHSDILSDIMRRTKCKP